MPQGVWFFFARFPPNGINLLIPYKFCTYVLIPEAHGASSS